MTAQRLNNAGALIDAPEAVTSGRVVARLEIQGSKSAGGEGQQELWKPKFQAKKGHLYWCVGGITMRCPENVTAEFVVWRAPVTGLPNGKEIQRDRIGGSGTTSARQTALPVYVNAMFTADADREENIWFVVNVKVDGKWLSDSWGATNADNQNWHNIYIIDLGPADALVPDYGSSVKGQRIDNAGALTTVERPSVVASVSGHDDHKDIAGTASGQIELLSATWTVKSGHQYLVIAVVPAVMTAINTFLRSLWLFDGVHNSARTQIGAYGGSSAFQPQMRPVTLVKVLDGLGSAAIYMNRAEGDGEWLTMDASHWIVVLDLGPK